MIIFIIDNDNQYQLIVINGKVKQSFSQNVIFGVTSEERK